MFNDTWSLASLRRAEDFHINLRNNDDFAVPFARLNLTERQPLTHFPKVWLNFQNENVKFIRNKLEFKEKLKEHLFKSAEKFGHLWQTFLSSVHSATPLIDCEIVFSSYVSHTSIKI